MAWCKWDEIKKQSCHLRDRQLLLAPPCQATWRRDQLNLHRSTPYHHEALPNNMAAFYTARLAVQAHERAIDSDAPCPGLQTLHALQHVTCRRLPRAHGILIHLDITCAHTSLLNSLCSLDLQVLRPHSQGQLEGRCIHDQPRFSADGAHA
jgi:hypothetical protein